MAEQTHSSKLQQRKTVELRIFTELCRVPQLEISSPQQDSPLRALPTCSFCLSTLQDLFDRTASTGVSAKPSLKSTPHHMPSLQYHNNNKFHFQTCPMLQPKTVAEKKADTLNGNEEVFEGIGMKEKENASDFNGRKKRYVLKRKKEYETRLRDEVLEGEKEEEWSWA